ncbi:unnamed protein product [Trichobilharzia szidati]|nr:unnamed protein product [Trichobilharzia szidati]
MSFTIEKLLKTDDALPSNKLNESLENSIDFNPEENADDVEDYQCDSYLRHHHYPQRRHSSDSIEQQRDERHSLRLSDNPQNELNISSYSCPPSLYSLQSIHSDMNQQLLSSSSPFQQVSPQSSSSSSPVTSSSSSTSLLSSTTATTTTFLSSPHSNPAHSNSISPNNDGDDEKSNVIIDSDYQSNTISPINQQGQCEYLNLFENVQHSHQNYSTITTTTTTTTTPTTTKH